MRAALVNKAGVVENVILLDEGSDFKPDKNLTLIILDVKDTVAQGYSWGNGKWTAPVAVTPVEPTASVEDQLAELKATVEMLLIQALEG